MSVRKPTPKSLAARRADRLAASRDTRAAILEALRAIREARKSIAKAGSFKAYIQPYKYPPAPTPIVCKTPVSDAITSKTIVLFPPHVPITICRNFRFPPHVPTAICYIRPKLVRTKITRKDFETALDAIELWLRYLLKVFDTIYAKQPTRRTPKSRP